MKIIEFTQTFFMDKLYYAAIKQNNNGNRYKFFSVIDSIFLAVIRFIAIYIILIEHVTHVKLRLILTIIISIIIVFIIKLINDAKFKKNEETVRLKAKKEIIKHKILCMPKIEADALFTDKNSDKVKFLIQKSSMISLDDIYEIIRVCVLKDITDFDVIGTSDLDAEADLFFKRHSGSRINYKSIFCFNVDYLASDDEITEWIIDEYENRKNSRKKIFVPLNAKNFLYTGLILLVLSFIVTFRNYMRLAAILSFSIAGLCIVLSERTQP